MNSNTLNHLPVPKIFFGSKRSWLMWMSALLVFTACQKDSPYVSPTEPDPEELEIAILSPAEDETFAAGSLIPIRFVATAPYELHGYSVRLVNPQENYSLSFLDIAHVHGTTLEYEANWQHPAGQADTLELWIDIATGHDAQPSVHRSRRIIIE